MKILSLFAMLLFAPLSHADDEGDPIMEAMIDSEKVKKEINEIQKGIEEENKKQNQEKSKSNRKKWIEKRNDEYDKKILQEYLAVENDKLKIDNEIINGDDVAEQAKRILAGLKKNQ